MERLTVDNPRNNREALLNFAYAKDGRVYLSYADGEAGVDLCEYVANNACCQEIDAAAVMDGACMECDCKTAILYVLAVQAAELRARLEYWENLEEEGRLMVLPCKVGDTLYFIDADEEGAWIDEYEVKYFYSSSRRINRIYCACGTQTKNFRPSYIGKTVFRTREEAEAVLKGGVVDA